MSTLVRFFIIFIFLGSIAQAEELSKKTICLNMIVKNESSVIRRSLESVKPLIDYWVILDTGSEDGTQEIIQEYMKGIPGELHEDPFRHFEYSRNKALDFAKNKGDYVLFIDADEEFTYAPDFQLPHLDKDSYLITIKNNNNVYGRISLIKNSLDWRWHGVLHEYIHSPQAKTSETLKGITNIYRPEGARSRDPEKYQKDAAILEKALESDPTNHRYRFYLAQSYRDAQMREKALENYQKVVEMNGWDQEVYCALLNKAILQMQLDMPPEVFLKSFIEAYDFRPSRAEPLYYVANYYRNKGDHLTANLFATIGTRIPLSSDVLFVQKWAYDWGLPLEKSVSAYWIGRYEECRDESLKMLSLPDLPESTRKTVTNNLQFSINKLVENGEK